MWTNISPSRPPKSLPLLYYITAAHPSTKFSANVIKPNKGEKERTGKTGRQKAGDSCGFLRGIPVAGDRTRPFLFWANTRIRSCFSETCVGEFR